jgi:hypothetical protein
VPNKKNQDFIPGFFVPPEALDGLEWVTKLFTPRYCSSIRHASHRRAFNFSPR